MGRTGFAKRAQGIGGADLIVHVGEILSGVPHLGSDIECDEKQQMKFGRAAQSKAVNVKVLS
jgi:hypothetical protein